MYRPNKLAGERKDGKEAPMKKSKNFDDGESEDLENELLSNFAGLSSQYRESKKLLETVEDTERKREMDHPDTKCCTFFILVILIVINPLP